MKYETYLQMQTSGPVFKPEHYHKAERKTIDYFFADISHHARILDVGCAIGLGMSYLKFLGYENVMGIDLDHRKIAENEHDVILGDVAQFDFTGIDPFDVIYCAHSLEHFYDPSAAVKNMQAITVSDAIFLFVLPYPNVNPSPAHWSTPIVGLDIDDNALTTRKWFENHGFHVDDFKHDDFREPEIWLRLSKK